METRRYAEALVLLEELLDAPPSQREARLQALQATDADLAAILARMLAADAQPDARLDHALSHPPGIDEPDTLIGTRIGVWKIVDVIGHGGMGVVYRAERGDGQFEQTSALKLIGVGLNRASALTRFLRERQILARLRHDNIATLIDGGITQQHEPWYAMELVDGTPLIDWCDQHRLGLRDRVLLFRQVLDAVRYAHSKLVVHRDLKPSNILVTAEGRVKLLDFGIAKLLEDNVTAPSQTIELVLTPEYAAPEQLVGDSAGPAADIYSLGVLLHVLLCGASPFDRSVAGHALLRRRLADLHADIEPLAQVAGKQPPESTAKRRLTPRALARALHGGLAAIVHRCLNSDPGQRYLNVDGLADDLERWLESRPVLAYRGHWRYRARQFLYRNRIAIAFTLLVATGIGAFTVYRSFQLAQARYERDLYSQTFEFVSDVIARATSGERGDELTVREALQLMLDEMEHRDLPADARSWLTSFIADSHASANDPVAAVAAGEQGARDTAGTNPLVQARLFEGQAMALEMAGKSKESLENIDRALAIVEAQKTDAVQIEALSRLLIMKVRYGIRQRLLPFAEAETLAKRAMSLTSAQAGKNKDGLQQHAEAGIALTDVYLLDRRYDEARANLLQVESKLKTGGLLGNDMLLDAYLTGQRLVLGDTEQVIPAFETLIEKWTEAYGSGFRTVASLKAQYAEALERAGRIDEALVASEEARRIARRNDAESIDVLDLDRLISRRLLRAGQYQRARTIAISLGETLATRQEPIARSMLALTWSLQADADLLEQQTDAAREAIQRGESVLASMESDDAGFVRARRNLDRARADYCLLIGDNACAVDHAKRAIAASVSVLDDPQDVLLVHRTLALATMAVPATQAEGARLLEQARTMAQQHFDRCNPFVSMMARTEPALGLAAMALPTSPECEKQGKRTALGAD